MTGQDLGAAERCFEEAQRALARRDLLAALEGFNRAEQQGASQDSCSGQRWEACMLLGNFEEAWRETDAIRRRGRPDPHRFWDGSDLAGKRVIVRSLHGLGDAVQMLRYAEMLRKIAASVVYEVPPLFVNLASLFLGVDEVITWGEGAPAVPPLWDSQIEIMELPYIFRTQLTELPCSTHYLIVPDETLSQTRAAIGPHKRLRIGVVWTAGSWNSARSIDLTDFAPLLHKEEVEFWNLQLPAAGDTSMLPTVRDATAVCGEGLSALASLIVHLDLVITVDTLSAHLTGALGKSGWVLLQHAADWRWMHMCDDSPWYPSLRIFRQPSPGDWQGVMLAVHNELNYLLGKKERRA